MLYFLQVIFVLWTIQQQQGCERAVVDSGGTVLRLGGLYHLRRGAHNYWVCSGKSPFASSPDGLINLIHYDDAADAVLCALKEKPGGEEGRKRQLYLVTDGVPISRKEIWYKKTIYLLCARSGKLVHVFCPQRCSQEEPLLLLLGRARVPGLGIGRKEVHRVQRQGGTR